MKNILKIAVVQIDLVWEDKKGNISKINNMLKELNEPIDLIILPEMFNTGFTMNSLEMSETYDSETINWMHFKAEEFNAVVTGSIIFKENENIFNRLIWMKPDGEFEYYDKRHLFRMGGENENYTGGKKKLIAEIHGWKVCPLICYDIRFPVWSRNIENYDLLIYVANWPASRQSVWDTLLKARALENQAYVCGVNRIGKDGEGVEYIGGTVMIDPKANEILTIENHKQKIGICEISLASLYEFRNRFPVLLDKDIFELMP